MMMTRSLGDWKHVAWILPQPQMARSRVGAEEHHRVIIASDGLWDVVSHEKCMELCRGAPTVQAAAEALVEAAKVVYLEHRQLELPGDDTTVLVVDLNPSQLAFVEPPPVASSGGDGSGCCLIF